MLSTSLMGQTGPHASVAGYGNIGAALAGFQQLVGWPGQLPIGPYGPYTDYVGPRFGIVALLGALDHRRRTGEGCHLDISQAEAGMQFLSAQIADFSISGRVVEHSGNRDPWMAPHGVFACRCDASAGAIAGGPPRQEPFVEGAYPAWVAIAARNDDEWRAMAHLIGGRELADDPRFRTLADRKAHEDALEALVGVWTEGRHVGVLPRVAAEHTRHHVGRAEQQQRQPRQPLCGALGDEGRVRRVQRRRAWETGNDAAEMPRQRKRQPKLP
jgi:crotonobetainyl-CoA:carnitine CoA-transferase CaiB-like acyl-CoA transferase